MGAKLTISKIKGGSLIAGISVLVFLLLVALLTILDSSNLFAIVLIFLAIIVTTLLIFRHFVARNFNWLLVAVLMISSLLNRYDIPLGSYTVRIEHVAGIIVSLVWITQCLLRGISFFKLDIPAFLAIAWGIINLTASLINAPHPEQTYVHILRIFILMVIYLTVSNAVAYKSDAWLRAWRAWMKLSMLAIAYGFVAWIVAVITGMNIGVDEPRMVPLFGLGGMAEFYISETLGGYTPYGTMLERNILGSFAASFLVMCIYILLKQNQLKKGVFFSNRFLWIGIILSLCVLLLSLTRAAWIASFLASALAYFQGSRSRKDILWRVLLTEAFVFVIFVSVILIIFFFPSDNQVVGRLATFKNLGEDSTWRLRLNDARMALQAFAAHPLIGNGAGSFSQIFGVRSGNMAWITNLILHDLVDTGIVGLSIQFLLFGSVLWQGLKIVKLTDDYRFAIGMNALILAVLTQLIAYQSTDATWFALIWINLGLISSGARSALRGTVVPPDKEV